MSVSSYQTLSPSNQVRAIVCLRNILIEKVDNKVWFVFFMQWEPQSKFHLSLLYSGGGKNLRDGDREYKNKRVYN